MCVHRSVKGERGESWSRLHLSHDTILKWVSANSKSNLCACPTGCGRPGVRVCVFHFV